MVPDMAHERAGVDALDGHDALARARYSPRLSWLRQLGAWAHVAHHERPQGRMLPPGRRRRSRRGALPGWVKAPRSAPHRRIGDDFQIAFHQGVEADLSKASPERPQEIYRRAPRRPQYEHRRRSRNRGGRPHLFAILLKGSVLSATRSLSPHVLRRRPAAHPCAFAPGSKARPVPAAAQSAPPWTGRSQAHKMKFAHRTLPVSQYRPLKVIFEHKTS